MRLCFLSKNVHGAVIFQDPLKSLLLKLEEFLTPLDEGPMVDYQETWCMGTDGMRHLYKKDRWNVNNMDIITNMSDTDQPGPSRTEAEKPSSKDVLFSQLNDAFDFNLKNEPNWEMYHQVEVIRIPQSILIRVVYRSSSGAYYSTTSVRGVVLLEKLVICYKKLPRTIATCLVDIFGNDYVMLDGNDVRNMT